VAHGSLPDVTAARKWLADLAGQPRTPYQRLESAKARQAVRFASPLS